MTGDASALEALAKAVASVRVDEDVSASRARQVEWVAGELALALERTEHPLGVTAPVAAVFAAESVEAYLALAARGELRRRAVRAPHRTSDKSRQVRIEALGILAAVLGVEAELPRLPDNPPAKRPVAKRPRSILRSSLLERADLPGAGVERVRLLAMIGVVLDTGPRAGELCRQGVEDLAPDLSETRLRRRPQGTPLDAPDVVELVELTRPTQAAVARWLRERAHLVAVAAGAADALWVSTRGNHAGEPGPCGNALTRPAGMPLQPRGLSRAYTRAVTALNEEMAGEPGWSPLPVRMEQLRRGSAPMPRLAPTHPDAERAARLLQDLTAAATELAEHTEFASDAIGDAKSAGTAVGGEVDLESVDALAARLEVRRAQRAAWAEGIEHRVVLATLARAGLTTGRQLAAAGWHPALLAAVDRAAGHGRAQRTG